MDCGHDFVQTRMRCVQTQMVVDKDGGKEIRKNTHWASTQICGHRCGVGQRTDVISNAMWLRKHAQSIQVSTLVTPVCPPLIRV